MHHVDLGLGYSPSEWPVAFVTRGLDEAFAELPDRSSRRGQLAGRSLPARGDRPRPGVGRAHREPHDASSPTTRALVPVDGVVSGWGCDVLAWLYGRDPSGAGLTASGDLSALRLPDWFPYP